MKPAPLLCTLAALAPAMAVADDRLVHHYVRSNSDGTEREDVIVFARSSTEIAVMKAKSRCTNAAYVTATLNAISGQAQSLVGGRLQRDGTQRAFAWLGYENGRLTARLGAPNAAPIFDIAAGPRWVLYDFDFSDLITRPPAEIALPLLLTGDGQPTMINRGEMRMRFVRLDRHAGRNVALYEASGPALAEGTGRLWFDARSNVLTETQLPLANHSEYKDFRLRLVKSERGEAAWKKRLMQHWKGCPDPKPD